MVGFKMKNIAIVSIMLMSVISTAQKIAVGPVLEVIVYVDDTKEYVSSNSGYLENPYTNIIIKKVGSIITFKLLKSDQTHIRSTYQIVKRRARKRVIYAKKLDDGSGSMIKIIQKKYTTEIHCDYDEKSNRFDGVFILGDLDFNKVKSSALDYLNLD